MSKQALVPLMVAASLCCALPAQSQSALPDGNGKNTVQTMCVQCHDLSQVTRAGYTQEGWQNVVHMRSGREGHPNLLPRPGRVRDSPGPNPGGRSAAPTRDWAKSGRGLPTTDTDQLGELYAQYRHSCPSDAAVSVAHR